ncbi:MAG: patatin [Gammaproteobacteria bacterium]|nr:MAG: patatin [Gammaproteobacteria bacterium]
MLNRRRLKQLEKQMDSANDYDAWKEAARKHDELSGMARWRQVDQTTLYDYGQIRLRLDKLRSLRAKRDYQGLLYTINEGIHGNIAGMGNPALYSRAKYGTKNLIEAYIHEVDDALKLLAELDTSVIPLQEKLDFFYRINVCFGRTGLMLSGGGALGFYHLGVVKAMLERNVLPTVISGSSAGSIMAALVGTHSDRQLKRFYQPAALLDEAREEASALTRLLSGRSSQIDVGDLERMIKRLIPNLTFQEAYAKTGRQISMSVAPAEPQQRSRLLNAITSPNVYVRSAVMASCAVPGVFPPVMLMAKNAHGEAQPYLPSRRWVDGSIADDLPAKRLSRLYSTNHYIVSMVNPVVIPFLSSNAAPRSRLSGLRSALAGLGVGMGREVLGFYQRLAQRDGEKWPRVNMVINSVHALLDQEYTGDINILPRFRWFNPAKLLSHLSEKELMALLREGELSAWGELDSRTLDEILQGFEQSGGEADKPRASRRRPPPVKTTPSKKRPRKPRAKKSAAKAPAKRSA